MTNTSSVRARREAALQQADITAGFYNLLDGQRLAAAQTLDVTDPRHRKGPGEGARRRPE